MQTNVTRISRFGFVNAYLVSEDDGLTLVDALVPRSAKVVLRAAEELGAPIVRIALTHAHGDHIGSLDELVAALPGVEVLISERDARLLHKDKSLDPGEPQRKLRGSYPGARTQPRRSYFYRGVTFSASQTSTMQDSNPCGTALSVRLW